MNPRAGKKFAFRCLIEDQCRNQSAGQAPGPAPASARGARTSGRFQTAGPCSDG